MDQRFCDRVGGMISQRDGEPCAECGDATGHGHHAVPPGTCASCHCAGFHATWCAERPELAGLRAERDALLDAVNRADAALSDESFDDHGQHAAACAALASVYDAPGRLARARHIAALGRVADAALAFADAAPAHVDDADDALRAALAALKAGG
jgi:hypothetical protein